MYYEDILPKLKSGFYSSLLSPAAGVGFSPEADSLFYTLLIAIRRLSLGVISRFPEWLVSLPQKFSASAKRVESLSRQR